MGAARRPQLAAWRRVRGGRFADGGPAPPVGPGSSARSNDADQSTKQGNARHRSRRRLTASHNALYELLHAPTVEHAVVATVHRGGDTDAAICGAPLEFDYTARRENVDVETCNAPS